jgi:hypothetical protein
MGGLYFGPAKSADSVWSFSADSKVLTLRGKVLDSVTHRTAALDDFDPEPWLDPSATTANGHPLRELIMTKYIPFVQFCETGSR